MNNDNKIKMIKELLEEKIEAANANIEHMNWYGTYGPPLAKEYQKLEICKEIMRIVNS